MVDTTETGLRRHDLLRIAPDAWAEALSRRADLTEMSVLRDWVHRGWPVIVRRGYADDPSDHVPVGVPLPPSLGKARIALTVAPGGVAERIAPLPLRDARAVAPAAWHTTIAGMLALAARLSVEPVVFGSLLWAHLTSLDYISRTSDLDTLWPVPAVGVGPLVAGLAAVDAGTPRLDGEIILADGSGVNWRELWHARDEGTTRILAKSQAGVRLVPASALMAGVPLS